MVQAWPRLVVRGAGIRSQRAAHAASYGDAPSRASELMRAPARLAGLMRARRAHVDHMWTHCGHNVDPKWTQSGLEERPVWAHRRPLGPVWTRGDGPDHMGTCVVPYGRLVGPQGPIMGPEELKVSLLYDMGPSTDL